MSLLLPFALVGCTPDAPVQPVGAPHTAAPDTSAPTAASTGETGPAVTGTAPGPVVVLVIGDGMGPAHLSAASVYRHGVDGGLAIHALPAQGTLRTASLSGITDSAAAATVLAAGAHTLDGRVAIDRYGSALPTIVDAARDRGWATAVVTTSRLPHATPAAFTAHHLDRDAEVAIADQQVGAVDVLLGGGASWYLPSDDPRSVRPDGGLLGAMAAAGVTWIEDPAALATAQPPMIGAFAASHLPYVGERPEGSASLQQLVDAAIAAIGDDPEGALLIVEGARIDHASHDNDLERAIGELLELDDVVAQLRSWSEPRGGLLIVTADHDCGGLDDIVPAGVGVVPGATWRWGNHSNARVTVSAAGPGSEALAGVDADHRAVHAAIIAAIDGAAPEVPVALVPDGSLLEHRFRVAEQSEPSGLGDRLGRLQGLTLDGDGFGLAVGVEGVFPWQTHAVVVAIDVDPGAGTGVTAFDGSLTDAELPIDRVISTLRVAAPPGIGFDVAAVSVGGVETPYLPPLRGVLGLAPPWGAPDAFGLLPGALNYAVETRTRPDAPLDVTPGLGMELLLPWTALWPALAGGVPTGAEVAVAAWLVGPNGDLSAAQFLPAGSAGPALPGAARFALDTDDDGVPGPFEAR